MERFLTPTPAWALSFPEPRSLPASISPDALHELVTTKAPVVDFIVVDVRRTGVDVRPMFKDPVVLSESHICHLPGRDPWCHQLACADVLSAAPDFDPPSHKDSGCDFPLLFVAR
jgi:hypothetical protein